MIMEPARLETDLQKQMAHLDLMEIRDTNSANIIPESSSRILRKRKSLASECNKPTNRRVSMRPRKHSIADNASSKEIEALYLNKKVKTLSQTLETIYEEPKPSNSKSEMLVGGRKIKRLLTFQIGSHYTKEKIKKRRAKIKKLLGNKSFLNRKKIPMNVFLKTIECLELDEVVHTESRTIDTVTT